MKPTRMALLAASAIAVALTSSSTFAGGKQGVDCSPGFWKNHQEIWDPASCLELNCPVLFNLLHLTGPQAGVFKNIAADIINGWATTNDIEACGD